MDRLAKALSMIALALIFVVGGPPPQARAGIQVSIKFEAKVVVKGQRQQSVERTVNSRLRSQMNRSPAELAKMAERIAAEELRKQGVKVGRARTTSSVRLSGKGARYVSSRTSSRYKTAAINRSVQMIKADVDKNPQAANTEVSGTFSIVIEIKF